MHRFSALASSISISAAMILGWEEIQAQPDPRAYMIERPSGSCIDLVAVVELDDQGLLLCARDSNGMALLRTTEMGDVVWKRQLLPSSTNISFVPIACARLDDESVFVAGYIWSGSRYDQFLAKVSLDGSLVWITQYQLPQSLDSSPHLNSAAKIPNGLRAVLKGINEIWIAQFSEDGTVEWCRKVTPPGDLSLWDTSLATNVSGNQLISCTLSQTFGSIYIPWLISLNPVGEIIWEKAYALGTTASIDGMCALDDAGFVLSGRMRDTIGSPSYDFLMKIDGASNVQWRKACTMASTSIQDIRQTADGGLIAVTSEYSSRPSLVKMTADGIPLAAVYAPQWSTSGGLGGQIGLSIAGELDSGVRVVGPVAVSAELWGAFCGLHQMEVNWSGPLPCRFDTSYFFTEDLSPPMTINTSAQVAAQTMTAVSLADFQWSAEVIEPSSFCEAVTGIPETGVFTEPVQQTILLVAAGQPVLLKDVPGDAVVDIFDLSGRVCRQSFEDLRGRDLIIETTTLVPGLYTVHIRNALVDRTVLRFLIQ